MMQGWMAQGARISVYAMGLGLAAAGGFVAIRASAAPPAATCALRKGEAVKVAEVLGGGAVRLSDGRKVLLAGIDTPRLDRKGAAAPFAAEAKAGLSRLLEGGRVTLGDAGAPSKSGWVRAQLFGANRWVQGELVSGGYARVRTFPDRRECAAELLAREAHARSAKLGIWALPAYAVQTPSTANKAEGAFGLVEGVIVNTANVGGRVFLNFGEDYRSDFTVQVKPDNVKLFAKSGIDLETLNGKRIRVRGFVRERNGPVIDAAVPEQIEVIP